MYQQQFIIYGSHLSSKNAFSGTRIWLYSRVSPFYNLCKSEKKIARGSERQTTRRRRVVGRDAPLLHCGYPTLSVLASDREAPWPAPTRLPVCVYWCSMVVHPHTAGCISWSLRRISQKRSSCYKGGHLLCLIYSKVKHSPCRLVVIRRQLLGLLLPSSEC